VLEISILVRDATWCNRAMKLKISAAMVTLALLSSCGGGGDDTGTVTERKDVNPIVQIDIDDDIVPTVISDSRPRPTSGVFSSDGSTLKSNGADLFSDTGVQSVDSDRVVSWPGLRYGNFLVINNPWNASASKYPAWYQDISLYETGSGYGVQFDWDWGSALDTDNPFDTKSFPEVIFGTKSANERSGTFEETGLPVEIFEAPSFTIDYSFEYEGRQSDSPNVGGTASEFNVAIESFYHDSCEITRNGGEEDNQIFEVMVWLKLDERKPAGGGPIDVVTTSDGRSFDVYTKHTKDNSIRLKDYIAFVAQEEQLSGTVQYSELLNIAQDKAVEYSLYPLKSTDCLANILMGTEVWHGAGTFNLNEYQINRLY